MTSIKRFIRNAIHFQELDGGIVPLRFTQKQMDFFASTPFKFRSFNAAGICFDFITDSDTLTLKYDIKIKPNTKENVLFDIFVDGRFIGFEGCEIDGKGSYEWTANLPIQQGKPQRVTVYLPYQARVVLHHFAVREGAVLEPAQPHELNLLCLGDSITQGMNALHPSSTYAALLARQLEMNILNQAVSGYIFTPDSIDSELPYKPDHITVAYGTNDWSVLETLEQFKQNASNYIEKLVQLYPNVPITVCSPIWRDEIADVKPVGTFSQIGETLEQICAAHGQIQFVNGLDLVPHHNDFYADGLHPTDEGFLHMALNLSKRIERFRANK